MEAIPAPRPYELGANMHAPHGEPATRILAALASAAFLAPATFLASACGPATHPAKPTARGTASRHPTSPSRPATPSGAYGNLRLGFVPASGAARPVRPPITVALVVRPAHGGAATTWTSTSAPAARGFQFHLTLPPGTYRLDELRLRSASLDPATVTVLTGGPTLTVPATGCSYLGVITIVLYRLPPGTASQQGAVAAQLAHGKSAYFTYLTTGGLIGDTAGTGLLPLSERPADSRACAVQQAKF